MAIFTLHIDNLRYSSLPFLLKGGVILNIELMPTINTKTRLLELLKRVCFLLDNSKESDWSPLSPKEVKANIETEMDLIRQGLSIDKDQLIIEFLPTSTLQEIAMVNNWHEEYIRLAKKFDLLIQSF